VRCMFTTYNVGHKSKVVWSAPRPVGRSLIYWINFVLSVDRAFLWGDGPTLCCRGARETSRMLKPRLEARRTRDGANTAKKKNRQRRTRPPAPQHPAHFCEAWAVRPFEFGGRGATDDEQMHGDDSDEPIPSIFD
jgi:hypothetical protein